MSVFLKFEFTVYVEHCCDDDAHKETHECQRADDDNGFEPSAASSDSPPNKGPRTSTVAAALRHRLAKAEPAGGTPVKTEPCAEEAVQAAPPPSRRPKAANK